jgi:hypothetical protein
LVTIAILFWKQVIINVRHICNKHIIGMYNRRASKLGRQLAVEAGAVGLDDLAVGVGGRQKGVRLEAWA